MIKVSSKGQFVIPASIRRRLGIRAGSRLRVRVEGGRIVLEPLAEDDPIRGLRGRFAGHDLLDELEDEHARELRDDPAVRP